ncbi:hypothetical protein QWZ16_09225 [Vibrio ostreicida]|uniref:Uncharacterized protein n=1 Tax=Vibrio ostreicida TaxID=526588 RepID=A0ABT8BUW3_9VIBR|nr:hypothetical protein [Vibrio ostreicida]MDN3609878.1 hypothetical protein [Vibrio ostreicida]
MDNKGSIPHHRETKTTPSFLDFNINLVTAKAIVCLLPESLIKFWYHPSITACLSKPTFHF